MERFKATIASLLNYRCPDWFGDAKFGIYLHWGVYSVAEHGEWYPRQMYIEGHPDYLHHLARYGHPSEQGYKDLVPLWKAEKWDPDGLVALFKRAGARYFTPCAVHHDNFDLWNSRHHRWNSVNMGPRRDITGEWRRAALTAGLRFGVTTHAERTWSWLQTNKGADMSGPKRGAPYDGNDPDYRDCYLAPSTDDNAAHPLNAPQSWRDHWAARMKDLIDNYHPDHLYFDGGVPFLGDDNGQTGLDVLAHLYNHSMEVHGGRQEAVMCVKNIGAHGIYVDGVCTLDLERTRSDVVRAAPWQTDTSVGPWGYDASASYRPAGEIVHELVDIVSKNGNLLLNVPPRADGTLDDATVCILTEIGDWLGLNGEAVYETRPWTVAAEGDVRFTRRGETVYATVLSWPASSQTLGILALGRHGGVGRIRDVSLLGYRGQLRWSQSGGDLRDYPGISGQLRVVRPPDLPPAHAWVLRVEFG